MPAEWRSIQLGDAVTFQRGFDLPAQDRVPGAVPIVSSSGVSGRHSQAAAKGPGVVTGRYGTIGQVFFISEDYWPLNTTLWIKDFHGNHVRFMSYMLRTVDYWSCSDKSSVPGVNRNDLHRLPIRLPPLPAQRAIASVLGALDDKIDLNRRMCQTLEEMARALFKSWFIDFDPVRAKMVGRDPRLPKEIADLFPSRLVDSELGPIPEGWRVAVLGEVVSELETGGRPRGGVAGILAGVPSVGAESITGLGQFDFAKTKYVPAEFYEAMTRGKVRSRDVLLYKDGGRPGEFEPHVSMFGDGFPFAKCSINEHVYRIRGSAELPQNFLYFHLSSEPAMAEMRVKGTGVAIPGLNSTQARSLRMVLPLPALMTMFDRTAEPMVARVLSAALESKQLADLRDTLLPKLISGELRVPASLGSMQEVAS